MAIHDPELDSDRGHRAPTRAEQGRPPEAFEDYAKAILALERRSGGPAKTNALAERLGLTAGSVTAMLKRMHEAGLVDHEPYHGATLTDSGRKLALEVLRHHRLLETYLADVLGMPWDRVHDEAEVLEHHISEDLEERMATALGDPQFDPHGDPIPGPELAPLDEDETVALAELRVGERGRLARVSDSDPELLRFLDSLGIGVGSTVEVADRQQFGGPLFLRVGGEEKVLGAEVAERIRVERV